MSIKFEQYKALTSAIKQEDLRTKMEQIDEVFRVRCHQLLSITGENDENSISQTMAEEQAIQDIESILQHLPYATNQINKLRKRLRKFMIDDQDNS